MAKPLQPLRISPTNPASRRSCRKPFGISEGLDILVNNAGVGHTPQPLETVTDDMFDRIANVNMKSIYYGTDHRAALQAAEIWRRAQCGLHRRRQSATEPYLVQCLERLGHHGDAAWPWSLRRSASGSTPSIPSPCETRLLKTFSGAGHARDPRQIPVDDSIGRFSTPEDMGNAAAFLCSNEASMITGVAMEVDDGRASDGDCRRRDHRQRSRRSLIEHDLRANAFRVCREETRFPLFRIML